MALVQFGYGQIFNFSLSLSYYFTINDTTKAFSPCVTKGPQEGAWAVYLDSRSTVVDRRSCSSDRVRCTVVEVTALERGELQLTPFGLSSCYHKKKRYIKYLIENISHRM